MEVLSLSAAPSCSQFVYFLAMYLSQMCALIVIISRGDYAYQSLYTFWMDVLRPMVSVLND